MKWIIDFRRSLQILLNGSIFAVQNLGRGRRLLSPQTSRLNTRLHAALLQEFLIEIKYCRKRCSLRRRIFQKSEVLCALSLVFAGATTLVDLDNLVYDSVVLNWKPTSCTGASDTTNAHPSMPTPTQFNTSECNSFILLKTGCPRAFLLNFGPQDDYMPSEQESLIFKNPATSSGLLFWVVLHVKHTMC